jgi:hypothetical protein
MCGYIAKIIEYFEYCKSAYKTLDMFIVIHQFYWLYMCALEMCYFLDQLVASQLWYFELECYIILIHYKQQLIYF